MKTVAMLFNSFVEFEANQGVTLTLPDLSLLLPTTLSKGGSVDPKLTHKPFALTTSDLVGF